MAKTVYVNCPACGHKLMEGETGSCVQLKCSKCGSIIRAELKPEQIILSHINTKPA